MASFRDTKNLEDFDFSFNPSIKKSQVFELATCKFIRERRDVLWVGPLDWQEPSVSGARPMRSALRPDGLLSLDLRYRQRLLA